MRCSSIAVQFCALLLLGCSTGSGHRPDATSGRIEQPAPSSAIVDPVSGGRQSQAITPDPATTQTAADRPTAGQGKRKTKSTNRHDIAMEEDAGGNAQSDRYRPLQNVTMIPITCASGEGEKDDCFETGRPGYWQPGGNITAARVYDPPDPTGASNFTLRKRKGRPEASDLVGVIKALKGDGLPLNSVEKDTDAAVLFRVRTDAVMLMWRRPF